MVAAKVGQPDTCLLPVKGTFCPGIQIALICGTGMVKRGTVKPKVKTAISFVKDAGSYCG